MATRLRPKAKNLYDDDFYIWTEVQAELLRRRQFEALDLDNLIEEVEASGRAEKSSVLSNASAIIEHLLNCSTARPLTHAMFGAPPSASTAAAYAAI